MGGIRDRKSIRGGGMTAVKAVLERLLGRSGSESKPSMKEPLAGFVGADTFEHVLIREKARADRSGLSFAVLVFETSNWSVRDGGAEALHLLGDVMLERVRLSDTLGWFGQNLGILVPDADESGAEAIARDVRDLFDRQKQSLNGHKPDFSDLRYITYLYDGSGVNADQSSSGVFGGNRRTGNAIYPEGKRNVRNQ